MKEKLGYKEGPTIDSKVRIKLMWQKMIFNICCEPFLWQRDDSYEDQEEEEESESKAIEPEEEKPTVVVLRKGDLTEEEANVFKEHEGMIGRNCYDRQVN